MRRLIPLLILAACSGGEWVREYEGALPGSDRGRYAAMIVDRRSGRPVEGATLRVYEADRILAEAGSDRYGLASIEWRPALAHGYWVTERAGYAPRVTLGPPGQRIELYPGRTARGRLLDGSGAPSASVEVEVYLGAAGAPVLRRTRTDGEGRFALHDLGGPEPAYLWAPAPNAVAREWPLLRAPVPGCVFETIRPEPGITVTGMLTGVRGNPVADALVFSRQHERGPRTRTDADGRFELVGVVPEPDLDASVPGARLRLESIDPLRPAASAPHERRPIRIETPDSIALYRFRIDGRIFTGGTVWTDRSGAVVIGFTHARCGDGRVIAEAGASLGPAAFPQPGRLEIDGAGIVAIEAWGGSARNDHEWAEIAPESYAIREGAWLRIRRPPGYATTYCRLGSGPPWRLTLGTASLEIIGAPYCHVDGERFEPANGRLLVRGLAPGPHIVLTPGRIARVTLAAGAYRVIR